MIILRVGVLALAVLAGLVVSASFAGARSAAVGPVTGLPMPRYVSMKAQEGNVRRGPSLDHSIDWVFKHENTPLRITAEHGHWRRVEDQSGAGGWMHYSLLSGARMALITQPATALLIKPNDGAAPAAMAEAGAILRVSECSAQWCRIGERGHKGWVRKARLWGVDPGEVFE